MCPITPSTTPSHRRTISTHGCLKHVGFDCHVSRNNNRGNNGSQNEPKDKVQPSVFIWKNVQKWGKPAIELVEGPDCGFLVLCYTPACKVVRLMKIILAFQTQSWGSYRNGPLFGTDCDESFWPKNTAWSTTYDKREICSCFPISGRLSQKSMKFFSKTKTMKMYSDLIFARSYGYQTNLSKDLQV